MGISVYSLSWTKSQIAQATKKYSGQIIQMLTQNLQKDPRPPLFLQTARSRAINKSSTEKSLLKTKAHKISYFTRFTYCTNTTSDKIF